MEKETHRINEEDGLAFNVIKKRLDLTSLDGLRGILACWIMVFHCCIYNHDFYIDLQGSSLMPMFFLLTGYQCAIAYRDIMPNDQSLIQAELPKYTVMSYYRGRIARVLPVYVFTNLLILPLEYLGYLSLNPSWGSPFIATYITTFTLTSTMSIFFLGSPFDGKYTIAVIIYL